VLLATGPNIKGVVFVDTDITINVIVHASVGVLIGVIGFIILKFKAVNLLAGYKPDKYDDDKLSRIAGSHLLVAGLFLIFGSVLYAVLPDQAVIVSLTAYFMLTVTIAKMIYHCKKYAKKK